MPQAPGLRGCDEDEDHTRDHRDGTRGLYVDLYLQRAQGGARETQFLGVNERSDASCGLRAADRRVVGMRGVDMRAVDMRAVDMRAVEMRAVAMRSVAMRSVDNRASCRHVRSRHAIC